MEGSRYSYIYLAAVLTVERFTFNALLQCISSWLEWHNAHNCLHSLRCNDTHTTTELDAILLLCHSLETLTHDACNVVIIEAREEL